MNSASRISSPLETGWAQTSRIFYHAPARASMAVCGGSRAVAKSLDGHWERSEAISLQGTTRCVGARLLRRKAPRKDFAQALVGAGARHSQ
jgi:hypothetical protein